MINKLKNKFKKKTPPFLSEVNCYNTHKTWVLSQGLSASVDYYIAPQLRKLNLGFQLIDTNQPAPELSTLEENNNLVVISRYVPTSWKSLIVKLHQKGRHIAYFMDDDLMDLSAITELQKNYQKKILINALKQRNLIESVCSEFWVSSAYLAEKYACWKPKLLEPRPVQTNQDTTPTFWLFYHGTSSHVAEFSWLHPIVDQIERNLPNSRFEVFGDHAIYKQFKHLPRATIVHPMQWSNYLDYTTHAQRDIGLVPLLPSKFNAGRGPTKFFDLTRMGAVGLYSNIEPYSDFIRHGIDGFLLPNDPLVWINTIMSLHQNPELRKRIVRTAQERMQDLESK